MKKAKSILVNSSKFSSISAVETFVTNPLCDKKGHGHLQVGDDWLQEILKAPLCWGFASSDYGL